MTATVDRRDRRPGRPVPGPCPGVGGRAGLRRSDRFALADPGHPDPGGAAHPARHDSAANAGWVVTATLLAGAIAMPIAGSLGDLFGKQRVLVASALMLLLGSSVVALSDYLVPVLVGRGLQGLAMGFIPVGISMIREVTPPELTATGIAAMSATLGVGGAVGLPLSAWVVQEFNWHIVFWVTAGLAALVAVTTYARGAARARRARRPVRRVRRARAGARARTVPGRGEQGQRVGLGQLRCRGRWALPASSYCCCGGGCSCASDCRWSTCGPPRGGPVLLTNVAAVAIGFGMMAQAIVVPQLMVLSTRTGHGLGQTRARGRAVDGPGRSGDDGVHADLEPAAAHGGAPGDAGGRRSDARRGLPLRLHLRHRAVAADDRLEPSAPPESAWATPRCRR